MKHLFSSLITLAALSVPTLRSARAQEISVPDTLSVDLFDVAVPVEDKGVMDTIDTPDKYVKIVLFADKTWEYLQLEAPKYMDAEAYAEYWDTVNISSYREVSLASLPDSVTLKLIDDLSEFHIPHEGKVYSRYGIRRGKAHHGIDLPLKVGEPVYATFEGKVRVSTYNSGGYGNLIIIRHPNGLETYHGHLSKRLVQIGEYVKAGELIGYSGNTGRSTGPHLHYETRYQGQSFDPERLIDFEKGVLRSDSITLKKAHFSIYSRYGSKETVNMNSAGEVYHTIRQGDTLGALARRYGTSVNKICRLNANLTPTTILRLGRRIRIR